MSWKIVILLIMTNDIYRAQCAHLIMWYEILNHYVRNYYMNRARTWSHFLQSNWIFRATLIMTIWWMKTKKFQGNLECSAKNGLFALNCYFDSFLDAIFLQLGTPHENCSIILFKNLALVAVTKNSTILTLFYSRSNLIGLKLNFFLTVNVFSAKLSSITLCRKSKPAQLLL